MGNYKGVGHMFRSICRRAQQARGTIRRLILASIVALLLGSTLGLAPASAVGKDSGVQSRACGNQIGYLTVNLKGSGNTWGPGDWNPASIPNHVSMWHGETSYFRVVTDWQSVGGHGGGSWRAVANDTYSYATAHCSSIGL